MLVQLLFSVLRFLGDIVELLQDLAKSRVYVGFRILQPIRWVVVLLRWLTLRPQFAQEFRILCAQPWDGFEFGDARLELLVGLPRFVKGCVRDSRGLLYCRVWLSTGCRVTSGSSGVCVAGRISTDSSGVRCTRVGTPVSASCWSSTSVC